MIVILGRLERLVRIKSSWCQCLDLGCLQETLISQTEQANQKQGQITSWYNLALYRDSVLNKPWLRLYIAKLLEHYSRCSCRHVDSWFPWEERFHYMICLFGLLEKKSFTSRGNLFLRRPHFVLSLPLSWSLHAEASGPACVFSVQCLRILGL